MPRAKKKTLSQKVVSVSAAGMPAPVQKVLSNRLVSLLVILIAPLLLALGVVTLDWENGFPKLSVNRERAEEVKEMAVERAQELCESNSKEGLGEIPSIRALSSLENKPAGFGEENTFASGFEIKPVESMRNLSNNLIGDHDGAFSADSVAENEDNESLLGNGPLSSMKKLLNNRR